MELGYGEGARPLNKAHLNLEAKAGREKKKEAKNKKNKIKYARRVDNFLLKGSPKWWISDPAGEKAVQYHLRGYYDAANTAAYTTTGVCQKKKKKILAKQNRKTER